LHLILTAKLIISNPHHYTDTTEGSTMEWTLSHSSVLTICPYIPLQ